ncbi:hypothetical protein GRI62_13930 [Erythrobacter arachoides]|uniref:Amidase n=1 Tax=Aurantiacibacter arachoides TaxID=1850444 RepID=A0A845AAX7_9SPHN|nr:hypothetical protein [Aurantiacibacter arachoides]MXO94699.1 hypothetical protein [Aurantiacibacter arachoides]GGD61384.1 hypothetical protein GCM10011411_22040 [Aurantiacibacter arachoides]
MATANRARSSALSIILKVVAVLAVAGFAVSWFFGTAITGFSGVGSAYAAKTVCSCRYVAGRAMDSCESDLPASMWAVWLSDDEEAKAVAARVPFVASERAQFREGYGCVLNSAEG